MAKEEKAVWLTTVDNPWDPFTQFVEWYKFDNEMGYDTFGLQARTAKLSNQFTEQEADEAWEAAMDEIIKYDFQNIYKKVYEK